MGRIRIDKIPVKGVVGLVFTLGIMAMFLIAIPVRQPTDCCSSAFPPVSSPLSSCASGTAARVKGTQSSAPL